MKKILILKILLLSINAIYAQKEANIWYFGVYAGLDFSSGVPVALSNSALYTEEGCATISDGMGNLLFYTGGVDVYNKNHVRMPNGFSLYGHTSSSNSSVAISKPGSNNIYYIFTVYSLGQNPGLNYSVVDMDLQGGLGDVTTKNVPLHTPVAEKLTAVGHANGCDFWVIAHEWESDKFLAYLVDSSGVNTNPVTSNVGMIHSYFYPDTGTFHAIGCMKVSPDGSKLALAISGAGFAELFDFDNTTGVVSNPISFPRFYNGNDPSYEYGYVYGVEFSPDNTKLYITNNMVRELFQYDLLAGSPTDIINSKTLVGSWFETRPPHRGYEYGALQIGPDGKIYLPMFYTDYLGVINDPNALGINCNYMDSAVYIGGGGRMSWLGLPNFMQGYFHPQFTYIKNCVGDSTLFSITDNNVDSLHWNFGDSLSGVLNTSTDFNPFHIYTAAGTYDVTLTSYKGCGREPVINSRTVIIYAGPPQINLGNDTLLCPGTSLKLNAEALGGKYLWQNGTTRKDFTVSSPGTYWVEVTNPCGSVRDSIIVNYAPPLGLNLGNDTVLCQGDTLLLDATMPGVSYQWQDSSTNPDFTVFSEGSYWVEVTSADGCSERDSILINYSTPPDVNLGDDTLLCQEETMVLDATEPGASYQWQDGSADPLFIVLSQGLYWVEVSNSDGCSNTDSIIISYSIPPPVSLGNDTILCNVQSLNLALNIPDVTYQWQDGSANSTFTASSSGLYWVIVSNKDSCSVSDSIFIEIKNLKADFAYEEIPCTDQIQFLNLSSDTSSSHWNFGDGTTSNENNPVHLYNAHEKYTVILIMLPNSACADTAQAIIPFEDDTVSDTLFIPNVFTPNGDGKNDYFEIAGAGNPCVEFNKLTIFNRWGKKVFEAEGSELKWDGTANGKRLAEGVYFYVLEGEEIRRSGSVTLIR